MHNRSLYPSNPYEGLTLWQRICLHVGLPVMLFFSAIGFLLLACVALVSPFTASEGVRTIFNELWGEDDDR